MKIQSLKLTNIGPYIGTNNVFEFSIDEFKPVTLIGGKNGAGKTTFLKTLKIGLFGAYSFGMSSNGQTYINRMKDLFNYRMMSEEKAQFAIEVNLLINEGFSQNRYQLKRKWDKNYDKFKYTEEIILIEPGSNGIGKKLKVDEIFEFTSKLKEIMPPNMIDAILFDGEEVSKIVSDNKISAYISDLFNTCFNVNIFNKLNSDLNVYTKKEQEDQILNEDEKKLLTLQSKIDQAKNSLKSMKSEQTVLKNQLENLVSQKEVLEVEYKTHKGINKSDRRKYEEKIKKHEKLRTEGSKEIKNFLENDFIFNVNLDLLNKVLEGIESYKPSIYLAQLEQIKNYVSSDQLSNVNSIIAELNESAVQNPLSFDLHNEEKIRSIVHSLKDISVKKLKNNQKALQISLFENKELKGLLDKNEHSEELKDLFEKITALNEQIEKTTDQKDQLAKKITLIERELTHDIEDYSTLERKTLTGKNINSSFGIAMNIQKVLNQFVDLQVKSKTSIIANLAKEKFEEVNKKVNYVSRFEINPENFEITMFDYENKQMSIDYLSAGEKQILLACLVWVIFKESKRDDIFIFDTPLARLDSENRELYIKNIMSNISSQVIILSTDEEFVGANYKHIESHIGSTYRLDNDPKYGKTTIEKGYF